jgi:hypothetical protein
MLFLPEDNWGGLVPARGRVRSHRAADPSLKGIAGLARRRAAQLRRVRLTTSPAIQRLAAIEKTLGGEPAYFSWRELLGGQPPDRREFRQFVEIDPVLDFNALEPGSGATGAIRQAAQDLKLADKGVTVRLTAPSPSPTTSSPP